MRQNNSPNIIKDIVALRFSTLNMVSPFADVDAAFNWLDSDFPTPHTHEHWEIFVVTVGTYLHKINGEEQVIKAGDAFLIRPEDRHSIHSTSGKNQHMNFIFNKEFAAKVINLYDNYNDVLKNEKYLHFFLDDTDIVYLHERGLFVQNLNKKEYEEQSKLIISYLIIKYFEQKKSFNPEYPLWLNNFIIYISSPLNFDKNVQELAENTSYSYSRLSRIFKSYTGDTIVNYVNNKKMIYAKRLLRTTDLSTLDICNKLGYASLSSFNHLFKKAFDMTPTAYRRKHDR